MATTWKALVKGGALTASASAFYTAPTGTYATIQAVSVNNPTASVVPIVIYKVPNGGSVGGAYVVAIRNAPAAASGVGTVQFPECVNHKLEPGDAIYATGNGCFLNVSGAENVPNT